MQKRYKELLQQIEQERQDGTGRDKNSHIMVIDGLNTFIRVFSAVPALNDDGQHIGGVTGFLRSIGAVIRQLKPTRCIIVFDGKGGSKRRKSIYSNYKANRANKTAFNRYQEFASLEDEQESMRRQFGRMIQYLNCLPVTTMSIDNVEADDIIAYIANEIYTEDHQKCTIVSTDRDFLQLVNHRINVWSPIKKRLYTPSLLQEEIGINEKNYLLYRAITGDKSDNIEGIKGVGLKSLIKYFPMLTEDREVSVDEIIDYAVQQDSKYKVVNTLAAAKDQLDLNYRLMQLKGVGLKSLIKYFPMLTEDREVSVDEIIDYAVQQDSKYKVVNTLAAAKDQLDLNYRLMQLKEVDIHGNAKMLALNMCKQDIQKLDVLEFKKMFMRDKMYTVIKDLDSWLNSSFMSLNAYGSI